MKQPLNPHLSLAHQTVDLHVLIRSDNFHSQGYSGLYDEVACRNRLALSRGQSKVLTDAVIIFKITFDAFK